LSRNIETQRTRIGCPHWLSPAAAAALRAPEAAARLGSGLARRHRLEHYAQRAAHAVGVACAAEQRPALSAAAGAWGVINRTRMGTCELLVGDHIDAVAGHALGPCGACRLLASCTGEDASSRMVGAAAAATAAAGAGGGAGGGEREAPGPGDGSTTKPEL
jgi:hypothetical protein